MRDFWKYYLLPAIKWTVAIIMVIVDVACWIGLMILTFAIHWTFSFLLIPAIFLVAVIMWYSEEILF